MVFENKICNKKEKPSDWSASIPACSAEFFSGLATFAFVQVEHN
jgi:hypothetical protein